MLPLRVVRAPFTPLYRLPTSVLSTSRASRSQCLFVRPIHTTSPNSANPIPHPASPAPPPPAPTNPNEAKRAEVEERVARKRKQAEMLKQAQAMRQGKASAADAKLRASALKKRFWKDVHVKSSPEGLQVHLDTRPIRNTQKEIITIPSSKPHLATALALEWDTLVSAAQATKSHYIPLTSLVSRALDIEAADKAGNREIRESIVAVCLRYLETDTLFCWAPSESRYSGTAEQEGRATLRDQQRTAAEPIISHLTSVVWPGTTLVPVLAEDSIMPVAQDKQTLSVIRGWLSGLPAWELAGVERSMLATKSLCIGVRIVAEWSEELRVAGGAAEQKQAFGVEEAENVATVEVRFQTEQWGEVEDTHDVDREDVRRQLGSVVLLVNGTKNA